MSQTIENHERIFHMLVGGGSTNIWKIPYVSSFLFLKASLTNLITFSENGEVLFINQFIICEIGISATRISAESVANIGYNLFILNNAIGKCSIST